MIYAVKNVYKQHLTDINSSKQHQQHQNNIKIERKKYIFLVSTHNPNILFHTQQRKTEKTLFSLYFSLSESKKASTIFAECFARANKHNLIWRFFYKVN